MSILRRQKLEEALRAIECAASNLLSAMEPARTRAAAEKPNSDGLLEAAAIAVGNARTFTRWAVTSLNAESPQCACGDPTRPGGDHGVTLCSFGIAPRDGFPRCACGDPIPIRSGTHSASQCSSAKIHLPQTHWIVR